LSLTGQAWAQAGPSPSPSPAAGSQSNPGEGGGAMPPATSQVTTGNGGSTVIIQPAPAGPARYGFGPSLEDLNKGLPSSSRSITGDQTDTFDLAPKSGGAGVVYGGPGATGIIGPQHAIEVPAIHV